MCAVPGIVQVPDIVTGLVFDIAIAGLLVGIDPVAQAVIDRTGGGSAKIDSVIIAYRSADVMLELLGRSL